MKITTQKKAIIELDENEAAQLKLILLSFVSNHMGFTWELEKNLCNKIIDDLTDKGFTVEDLP